MIDAWLDLPIPLMVLAAAILFASSAILFNWLMHHSPAAERIASYRGIVGPFFVSISVLFALFLTFLAADVWDRKTRASHVVQSERDALAGLVALARTSPVTAGAITDAVESYVNSAIQDEWRHMRNQKSSPQTAERMDRLLHTVATASSSYAAAVHGAMLQKAVDVGEARASRIALSHDRAETLKWLAVIVLALLTQLALAAVHLDKTAPQRLALALFSVSAVFAICVVAAYERPFDGPLSVPPDPLAELIRSS